MPDTTGKQTMCGMVSFLTTASLCFAAVTILQFSWIRDLQQKYTHSMVLVQHFQLILQQHGLYIEPATAMDQAKRRRDASATTLHELLMDLMLEQEKILMEHCENSTKLCITGEKGSQGVKGDIGVPGIKGIKGLSGKDGTKGDLGVAGYNGTDGDTGPKGEPGQKGLKGRKGEIGLPGTEGMAGYNGTDGQKGDMGMPGDKGEPGLKGDMGMTGPPGVDGLNGTDGSKGEKGEKGDTGIQGPPGVDGMQLSSNCVCLNPYTIEPEVVEVHGHIGSPVKLDCTNNRTTSPTFIWDIPDSAKCVTTNTTLPHLNIDDLQPSQAGNYTCTDPSTGEAIKTFTLQAIGDPLKCDFENNDLCLWHTNGSTLGTWSTRMGSTSTLNTGPHNDHTLGNGQNGKYAYIEGSFDRIGDHGNLISPQLAPSSDSSCLYFWYHMHGADIGSLKVLRIEYVPDATSVNCAVKDPVKKLVAISGDQGDVWHDIFIELSPIPHPYKIVMQAVHGEGNQGDIAVDDIQHIQGSCFSKVAVVGPTEENITVSANTALSLNCSVTGGLPPTFKWTKTNSNQTFTNNQMLPLSVPLREVDSGTYICEATNLMGTISKTFHVDVKPATLAVIGATEEHIIVTKNTSLSLNCSVAYSGTSQPSFYWTKLNGCMNYTNGEVLKVGDMTTGFLTAVDAGTYTCEATTKAGTVTKSFQVTVNASADNCTFDDGSTCDWTQDNTDDFDWTMQKGPTQSDDTGPLRDHTSQHGNYIYIEASSPTEEGDYANLLSHALPGNQTKCLTFFYTMFGQDSGFLNVSVVDLCTGNETTVYATSGDHGQAWQEGTVTIPASIVPHDYKIKVHATVGNGYLSDTAIDDIVISDSECKVPDLNCDFSVNTCMWKQTILDQFDWTRNKGDTSSSLTGPHGDHTLPTGSGYYMYTEATGQHVGDFADLLSPILPAGQQYCLTFFTNLYGRNIGHIELIIWTIAGGFPYVETFNSTSKPVWQQHNVNIDRQTDNFVFIIRGTVGGGFQSDAAIDDVSLHSGRCP